MKIKDGLKIKGAPAEIPDCGREDLPQFCIDMGYKVGAEIGVQAGIFLELFCHAGLKMYGIDPWHNYEGYWGEGAFAKENEDLYNGCVEMAKKYDCTLIKKTSLDALADFADNSLDFVYIDGNHDFRYVADDLYEWTKKVRPGGMIAGHDYFYAQKRVYDNIHVKYVVDAFTKCYKINQWYVLGRKSKVAPDEKRDKFRSFMWLKD